MPDIISQIFNEVIAIFNVDEKDADDKGSWKKFEKSLKEILSKKAKVTEEFVEKWINIIRPETPVSIRLAIKDMLKEAGVEVVGK